MRLAMATFVTLVAAWPASAQSPASVTIPPPLVPPPDVTFSVGWLNVNKSGLDEYNDWYNRSVHGAMAFGWYWSTHLKTELEASASSRAELYAARQETIGGARAFVLSEYGFSTRRLTLAQQYQFGENAWFHPHLAAGVDVSWETVRRFDRETYFYEATARPPTILLPSVRHSNVIDVHVRPFLGAGFKGYFTSRGFMRSDLRVVVGHRIEEVLLRIGLGVDF